MTASVEDLLNQVIANQASAATELAALQADVTTIKNTQAATVTLQPVLDAVTAVATQVTALNSLIAPSPTPAATPAASEPAATGASVSNENGTGTSASETAGTAATSATAAQ